MPLFSWVESMGTIVDAEVLERNTVAAVAGAFRESLELGLVADHQDTRAQASYRRLDVLNSVHYQCS